MLEISKLLEQVKSVWFPLHIPAHLYSAFLSYCRLLMVKDRQHKQKGFGNVSVTGLKLPVLLKNN